jgi:3-hydroxyacyl-CoA dehydrogenase
MRVGVIGAGTMGTGIVHAFLTTGSEVMPAELDGPTRETAAARIASVIDSGVRQPVAAPAPTRDGRERSSGQEDRPGAQCLEQRGPSCVKR